MGKASPLQNTNPISELIQYLEANSNLKILNCFSKGNTFGALQNLNLVKGLNEFVNEFDISKRNIVFTIGANPVNNSIYSLKIKDSLVNADFVVSMDLFKNETTELSDIILPTTSLGEKE